jgi:flagellar hook-length control protein FliK
VKVENFHIPIASEPSLYQNSYAQTNAERSFKQYLDEEKNRIGLLFSPWGQHDFSSWFAYPDSTKNPESLIGNIPLFSDMESSYESRGSSSRSENVFGSQSPTITQQVINQIANNAASQPNQISLQQLLMKSGWLTPNLEAHHFFYQAQLQGKLLNKLDLQSLVDQIISQVKMVKEKGKTQLALTLKPENLGEILLTLTSRSGMVSIQIQGPEETLKLISEDLKELELALKKANINLAEIKIGETKEVGKHV